MSDEKKDPLMRDLEVYASEQDATLTVPHFVSWLLKNRPALARINIKELEIMAKESLVKFAHAAVEPPSKPDP